MPRRIRRVVGGKKKNLAKKITASMRPPTKYDIIQKRLAKQKAAKAKAARRAKTAVPSVKTAARSRPGRRGRAGQSGTESSSRRRA